MKQEYSYYIIYEQDSDWYSTKFDTLDKAMEEVRYMEKQDKDTEYYIYKNTVKNERVTGQKCVYFGR